MILHLLYILAFTALAFLAVGNLIRNLMALGIESQRQYPTTARSQNRSVPHPELLDDQGRVINEPLLVMRSMSVEDAREQLDAIYKSSPSGESAPSNDD